ncbi:hypothetical protein [Sporisorium scitamineum]|uniref:Uncharacterized protein n=1 Tax=Sporisorium scitamineum TaxID=49012 RepID=A0A0F7RUI2_9BASI|nr:hypothetical protein [Sporisorium scitamineum]
MLHQSPSRYGLRAGHLESGFGSALICWFYRNYKYSQRDTACR